jgi:hypothetical protein
MRVHFSDRVSDSIRIRRGGADDADAVVGEWCVHAGDFDVGHVAARAVACCDRTCRSWMIGELFRCFCHVARQAFGIVARGVCEEWLVWVVARVTREPGITATPALTALQSIRLKANVRDTGDFGCRTSAQVR